MDGYEADPLAKLPTQGPSLHQTGLDLMLPRARLALETRESSLGRRTQTKSKLTGDDAGADADADADRHQQLLDL